MNKNKLLKIFLLFFLVSSVLLPSIVFADPVDCTGPYNTRPEECLPPTLGDLQTTLVSLIGSIYALSGVMFMGILLYNGLIYLLGYIDDAKYILGATIEDAQKRMTQWLIGFLMVLISYPLVNGFMQVIVGDSSCYEKLNNPTVQFIFPEVCDIGEESSDSPTTTPTIIPINTSTPVETPTITMDATSCALWGASIRGNPNLFCENKCSSSGQRYQSFDNTANSPQPQTIWCDCKLFVCHAITYP